jgi:hypothetical protein
MSPFSNFAISLGLFLVLTTTIAAWLFRLATAPLAMKLIVPAMLIVVACATPWQARPLMGFPYPLPFASLPRSAELIAFVTHDEESCVDLWLREGDAPPRAYETALDDGMKKTLRAAHDRLEQGHRVMLTKEAHDSKRSHFNRGVNSNDNAPYELEDSAFSLPPKD